MNNGICCYIGAYLFNIKAIRVVEGNIKGLFGMFSKKKKDSDYSEF